MVLLQTKSDKEKPQYYYKTYLTKARRDNQLYISYSGIWSKLNKQLLFSFHIYKKDCDKLELKEQEVCLHV